MLIAEIFSRVDAEELLSELKKQGKVKLWQEVMEACEIYGLKHYARADKNLKESFYLQYVMSQITLQSEIKAKPVVKKRE
jgi:L-rhamnose mutarotase